MTRTTILTHRQMPYNVKCEAEITKVLAIAVETMTDISLRSIVAIRLALQTYCNSFPTLPQA